MKKESFIILIQKELTGEIIPEEKVLLDDFLNLSSENEDFYSDIKLSWELSNKTINFQNLNIEEDLANLKKRMPYQMETHKPPRQRRVLKIAATILLLITAGFLFKNYSSFFSTTKELFAENENLIFELPDGSKGTLRKGSKLIYQKAFEENRNSTLIGTANFEVTHNPTKPFQVTIDDARVKVLGTTFSINKSEERLTVSVSSGKVIFTQNDYSIILNKDEVGVYDSKTSFPTKSSSPSSNFLYWQKNQFRFDRESLQSITQQLELIYGIDIKILNSSMNECQLSGVFNGNNPQSILKNIARKFKMNVVADSEKTYKLDQGICN